MITSTHLLLAMAVFSKPNQPKLTISALIGGFLPDFSLYFMFFWHYFRVQTAAEDIFNRIYFSSYWQNIFAIDNSFLIWGGALIIALWMRHKIFIVFSASGCLHLLFDFPLHHDDARPHFWPITLWKFESPVSYWDPNHYGQIITVIELIFAVILLLILWFRFKSFYLRIFRSVLFLFFPRK